jgi:hypothetical protein
VQEKRYRNETQCQFICLLKENRSAKGTTANVLHTWLDDFLDDLRSDGA